MPTLLLAFALTFDKTPESTIRTFLKAFNARHGTEAAKQVVGGKTGKIPTGAERLSLTAVLGKKTIAGDTAKIEAEVVIFGRDKPVNAHETIALRRVGGGWKIVPADPRAGGMSETKYVGFLAYYIVHPEPAFGTPRETKQSLCLSNVKQLALGTIRYAIAHNDTLPKTSAGWKAAIMPYVKSEKVFHCPDDASGGISYFLDPRLAGKALTAIARPAETAMIVEGTPTKAAIRHTGKASLGYADGHVKGVDRAVLTNARSISLK